MSSSKTKQSKALAQPQIEEINIKDLKQLTEMMSGKNNASSIQDPVLQKKVNALKNIQLDMVKVEAKFFDELHELECKYSKLYEPFYEKRKQIVTGEYEPNEVEGKWALDDDEKEEEDESSKAKKAIEPASPATGDAKKEEKGITNFWLDTLQAFRITAEIIQEVDEPVLAYLQDIRVKLFDKQPQGYMLEFHFAENPFFTNKVLTKMYELTTEIDAKDPFSFDGPDLSKSIGCKIDWKDGKNVTVKIVKKKLKSKNKKVPPKIISKEEEQESFFNFFKSLDENKSKKVAKRNNEEEDDDLDEEDSEELMKIADFEIGQYLREKVVPKAVLYYSGEIDGFEDDYDDEFADEDEEGDEGEEDDDEEEDEDDEEEDLGKKGKSLISKKSTLSSGSKANTKSNPNTKSGSGPEPTPAECKQS